MLKIFNKRKKKEANNSVAEAETAIRKKSEGETVQMVNREKVAAHRPISQAGLALKHPHSAEKSFGLQKLNKYVFVAADRANKPEIKKSIEKLYDVKVMGVNIVNIPRKKRRFGRSEGYKKGYKKAMVTLKAGDRIKDL